MEQAEFFMSLVLRILIVFVFFILFFSVGIVLESPNTKA